ncbi:hypothetical protein GTA51_14935 [Desulfovibrio aerotolerans]|uniref:Uncharacterized protein n=1 Tax=Solidesulfovibrio aerotolerans TaxID=295255 RepID=A0A7C9IV51_9BACT|nr:hypothetical protein [Solidesulfovibrio aerotolerans]MYL84420.1 hypothetical protein [Solidesulfovibrio aerotolerans]
MEDCYTFFISEQISKIRASLRRKGYYPSRDRLVKNLNIAIDAFADRYADLQD